MRKSTPDENSAASVRTQEPASTDVRRRRFLFTLGAGGASAAVAVSGALPGTAAAESAAAPIDDRNSPYRATEHVRDYYRTTRI
jgi:hypothetical protein